MARRFTIHEKATLLRDAVFAASDGIVTTFAIVAGATGASLTSSVVIILGFANLFADGLSMASGNYLGVKSEVEYQKAKDDNFRREHSPKRHGFVTFISFTGAGILPLLPFVLNTPSKFLFSSVIVGTELFLIGSLRALYAKKKWLAGGVEMFVIGGAAASVAFFIGFLLDRYLI